MITRLGSIARMSLTLASSAAIALTSTTAQAAQTLSLSDDPWVAAYTILGAAGAIVVVLGIGAYTLERHNH